MARLTAAAEWLRSTVTITVGPEESPGKVTAAAWITDRAPGLAVSRAMTEDAVSRLYVVTHVASGRVIVAGLSKPGARRVALAVAPLADWSPTVPVPLPPAELLPLAVSTLAERIGGRGGGPG